MNSNISNSNTPSTRRKAPPAPPASKPAPAPARPGRKIPAAPAQDTPVLARKTVRRCTHAETLTSSPDALAAAIERYNNAIAAARAVPAPAPVVEKKHLWTRFKAGLVAFFQKLLLASVVLAVVIAVGAGLFAFGTEGAPYAVAGFATKVDEYKAAKQQSRNLHTAIESARVLDTEFGGRQIAPGEWQACTEVSDGCMRLFDAYGSDSLLVLQTVRHGIWNFTALVPGAFERSR